MQIFCNWKEEPFRVILSMRGEPPRDRCLYQDTHQTTNADWLLQNNFHFNVMFEELLKTRQQCFEMFLPNRWLRDKWIISMHSFICHIDILKSRNNMRTVLSYCAERFWFISSVYIHIIIYRKKESQWKKRSNLC